MSGFLILLLTGLLGEFLGTVQTLSCGDGGQCLLDNTFCREIPGDCPPAFKCCERRRRGKLF